MAPLFICFFIAITVSYLFGGEYLNPPINKLIENLIVWWTVTCHPYLPNIDYTNFTKNIQYRLSKN